jgi:hypothetical protein
MELSHMFHFLKQNNNIIITLKHLMVQNHYFHEILIISTLYVKSI